MARLRRCSLEMCLFWLLAACMVFGRFSEGSFLMNSNRYSSANRRAKHNANSTATTPTITVHLEGFDLHRNALLAITREDGKIGTACNQTYFIMTDIPVVSADGSSGDIELNEALHAELSLTSWHLCIRQQTSKPNSGLI
ncbi:uncharacterized protein CEXT_8241 [Caerostris extrusa]|uniref:Dirigent protein n=1 Tax=Caerostris extrusa TaxID=172846 RepID=A0AAV4WVY9_CAEEX|nr:uncharacterized protein CEXT_8241 [Caerostris extrusa]